MLKSHDRALSRALPVTLHLLGCALVATACATGEDEGDLIFLTTADPEQAVDGGLAAASADVPSAPRAPDGGWLSGGSSAWSTGPGAAPSSAGALPQGSGSAPDAAGEFTGSGASAPTAPIAPPAYGTAAPAPVAPSCLAGPVPYDAEGPFSYTQRNVGRIKYWVPRVPSGCKVPVVHLANGTGARCSTYQQVLNRLASHGFLTACYEDTNTGAGSQGLEALQTAYKEFPELAGDAIGSTGHSQGGQAAFTVLELAEKTFGAGKRYAGLAMQPASGFGEQPRGGNWRDVYARIRSPMFMFSGTADTLVSESWVRRGFAALADDIEAYNWSANGATHIPTPQTATNSVIIAWFRWKLLGDGAACTYFKSLPAKAAWDSKEEQNAAACP